MKEMVVFRTFVPLTAGPLNYIWWTTKSQGKCKESVMAVSLSTGPKSLTFFRSTFKIAWIAVCLSLIQAGWFSIPNPRETFSCYSGYTRNHSAASNSLIVLVPIFIGISDFTLKLVAYKPVYHHLSQKLWTGFCSSSPVLDVLTSPCASSAVHIRNVLDLRIA